MKKSEMLKEMSLHIAKQAITSGNHDIDLTWLDVDKLLVRMESLGMAPPFYDKVQNNNGEEVIVPAREWEPE